MIQRRSPLRRTAKPIRRSRIRPRKETRRRRAHRNRVIAEVRSAVFARDANCRRCQWPGFQEDQMHEVESRAMLRGRPAADVYNTKNCIRVCVQCHLLFTERKEDIVYLDPDQGCNGEIVCVPRPPKPTPWKAAESEGC